MRGILLVGLFAGLFVGLFVGNLQEATMLKTFLLLLAAVAAFAGYVALQPSEFRIARTGRINAPQDKVFDHVNDFHKWQEWSPWAKLDPNAKATFEGAAAGNGASFSWSGNNDVGEGKMTITDSRANDYIKMALDFSKPMEANNIAEFTFKPDGAGATQMTWVMSGQNNFLARAMCLVFNADKMVGGQFEKGFENLNAVLAAKR